MRLPLHLRIKPGDYLITKNKTVYRITGAYMHQDSMEETAFLYDIRGYEKLDYTYQDSYGDYTYTSYPEIKGITHSELLEIGVVVPEEKFTEAMEILYIK